MDKSYTEDSQGRRTRIVLHQGAQGDVSRTYSFNHLGDVVEERAILTTSASMPVGVVFHVDEAGNPVPEKPSSEWPSQPEFPNQCVHHTYQYDSYGDWTEQKVIRSDSRHTPRRRGHSYY